MKIIIILLALTSILNLTAQPLSIERSVIASQSGTEVVNGLFISYSIGQPIASTIQGGTIILTQGFQQPKTVKITEPVTSQVINMVRGWNIVSSYIQPTTPNMVSVFSPIVGNILLVKDADGKVYAPTLNQNSIGNWEVGKGYQVKTNAAVALTINGTQVKPQSTPVNIKTGWQIIPFWRTNADNATTVLNSITDNIIILKNNTGQIYTTGVQAFNTIGNLQPGQGYWLKAKSNGTLSYPAN